MSPEAGFESLVPPSPASDWPFARPPWGCPPLTRLRLCMIPHSSGLPAAVEVNFLG